MPVSEVDSGTHLATGAEDTVDTVVSAGTYVWVIDLSNMASGDEVTLRVKDKVLTGGAFVLAFKQDYKNDQAVDWVSSEPVVTAHEATFTLEQTAGTNRNFDWSVRSVN